MGLDACVCCDCFEASRLRNPLPENVDVYISEEGRLECRNADLDTQLAFDRWRCLDACEHEDGVLLHHYIGDTTVVSMLHQELSSQSDDFPIILSKVVYSGLHSGDFLTAAQVFDLQTEISRLRVFRCSNSESQRAMDRFCSQMDELAKCALAVKKPIVF